jgi:hypothetical protein
MRILPGEVRQNLFFQPREQVTKLSQLRLLKHELPPAVNMTPDNGPTRIHDQKIGVQVIKRRLVSLLQTKNCWECPHEWSVVKLEHGTESVRGRLREGPACLQVSYPTVVTEGVGEKTLGESVCVMCGPIHTKLHLDLKS